MVGLEVCIMDVDSSGKVGLSRSFGNLNVDLQVRRHSSDMYINLLDED